MNSQLTEFMQILQSTQTKLGERVKKKRKKVMKAKLFEKIIKIFKLRYVSE